MTRGTLNLDDLDRGSRDCGSLRQEHCGELTLLDRVQEALRRRDEALTTVAEPAPPAATVRRRRSVKVEGGRKKLHRERLEREAGSTQRKLGISSRREVGPLLDR
jgi:hypothetical protein